MSTDIPMDTDDVCPVCGAPLVEQPDGTVTCDHRNPPSADEWPIFDLEWARNEDDNEITIMQTDPDLTNWITADESDVVDIREVR